MDENHTMGNALRYIVSRDQDTNFCGYSIPHPNEPEMKIRLQTNNEVPASTVMKKGLDNLNAISQHVQKSFAAALRDLEKNKKIAQNRDGGMDESE